MKNSANSAVEGNTNSPTAKRQPNPSNRWCFTLNNYTQEEYDDMISALVQISTRYVVGKERGDQGTPHLQGYYETEDRTRPTALKLKHLRTHFEKAKGTDVQNYKYCIKEGSHVEGGFTREWKLKNKLTVHRGLLRKEQLFWWQKWLEGEYLYSIDNYEDRYIFWIWSSKGSLGKTAFCRYMKNTYDAGFLTNGKCSDIANYIINKGMKNCYCFNFTKSSIKTINYGAIENVKDGLMFSPKYEADDIDMESPFVVCMANEPPDLEKMSEDRWIVLNVDENLEEEAFNDSYIDVIIKRLI